MLFYLCFGINFAMIITDGIKLVALSEILSKTHPAKVRGQAIRKNQNIMKSGLFIPAI